MKRWRDMKKDGNWYRKPPVNGRMDDSRLSDATRSEGGQREWYRYTGYGKYMRRPTGATTEKRRNLKKVKDGMTNLYEDEEYRHVPAWAR